MPYGLPLAASIPFISVFIIFGIEGGSTLGDYGIDIGSLKTAIYCCSTFFVIFIIYSIIIMNLLPLKARLSLFFLEY